MNSRKANSAFFISIILYLICVVGATYAFPALVENLIWSNLLCEAVVLLPGLLFAFFSGEKLTEFMGFRKMKLTTALAIIPFTMFTTPFVTVLNLISQFFTENAVTAMMTEYQVAQMPFLPLFFAVAVFAPFCEEVACRGVYYRSYKKSGGAFKAMLLSSLLFAVVHMNLNQAIYAFAVGVLAVLLVEATGSLWSSILYHGLINGSQIIMMYVTLKMEPQVYSEASAQLVTTEMLVYSVAVYLVIAAVFLPLGWALLVWMSGREGRRGVLAIVWQDRKKKDKVVSVSLILALILCVAIMVSPAVLSLLMQWGYIN